MSVHKTVWFSSLPRYYLNYLRLSFNVVHKKPVQDRNFCKTHKFTLSILYEVIYFEFWIAYIFATKWTSIRNIIFGMTFPLKVNKNRNYFMKTPFGPKSNVIIVRISALLLPYIKVAFFQKVRCVFQISKSPKKYIPKNYPELEI